MKKRWFLSVLLGFCVCLMSAICFASCGKSGGETGIFNAKKVSQVELGMSKREVGEILGTPNAVDEDGFTYFWYESKVQNLFDEIEKAEEEWLENDDFADFEDSFAKLEKLYMRLEDMTYQFIMVKFSYAEEVEEVFLDREHKYDDLSNYVSRTEKRVKNVQMDVESVDEIRAEVSGRYTIGKNRTESEEIITSNISSQQGLVYRAEFVDGSYILCTATPTVKSTVSEGTHLNVEWSDNVAEYTARVPATIQYQNCTVIVEEGVKSIGQSDIGAYRSKVVSVSLPSTLVSIGDKAFYDCSSLTEIVIPDGVTSIGDRAFYNCNGLTKIVIPTLVTSIGEYAFYDCDNLTIYCEAESKPSGWNSRWNDSNCPVMWQYVDGIEYKIPSDGTYATVTGYHGKATKVIIARTYRGVPVTVIGDYAFYKCDNLTSVIISDSVTSIGERAFSYCSNLTEIIISDSVTSISYNAFDECIRLTSITVDENNTAYKDVDGDLYTKDGKTLIRYACGKMASTFSIPNGVTSISENAFWNGYKLTEITIPDSMTSIADGALYSCISLTSIKVSKNNTAYKDIDGNLYTKDGKTLIQYAIGKTASTFSIPDGVTSIDSAAFGGCENLTDIVIPNSVTSIDSGAFDGCYSLQGTEKGGLIYLGNPNNPYLYLYYSSNAKNLTSVIIEDGCQVIGNGALVGCRSMTEVVIPDSVTSIGDGAFYECRNLTKITIPDGVTSIGDRAFEYCTGLESIEIPDSVTSIGDEAFEYCTGLESIEIPDSVTSIGKGAFYFCTVLTSIIIPDSVTSIGKGAFSNCIHLTIYCEAESKPIGWDDNWKSGPVVWGYKGE